MFPGLSRIALKSPLQLPQTPSPELPQTSFQNFPDPLSRKFPEPLSRNFPEPRSRNFPELPGTTFPELPGTLRSNTISYLISISLGAPRASPEHPEISSGNFPKRLSRNFPKLPGTARNRCPETSRNFPEPPGSAFLEPRSREPLSQTPSNLRLPSEPSHHQADSTSADSSQPTRGLPGLPYSLAVRGGLGASVRRNPLLSESDRRDLPPYI